MRRIVLAALVAVIAASSAAAAAAPGPFVTVYSRDLGFVRETRTLAKGFFGNTARLEDVSTRLDFSSVRVVPSVGRVTRLAYRWDVASGDAMIERAVGQNVRVLSREHQVAEGMLLSADGSWLVLRTADGLATLNRASVDAVQLAGVPSSFSLKPAIELELDGTKGATSAELSYLTGGLSWNAEHMLVRTGETSAVWSTRVIIENTTGRDYVDAVVKLVAGEPARASAPMPKPAPMMMRAMDAMVAGAAPEMTEASFSEYHLYTLNAPATLRDRESQSLLMIDPRPIAVTPRYLYRGGDSQGVLAQLELVNSAKAGPGVPLPAGRVRTFETDASGAMQFTGERNVAHTPVDEKLTIDVGYAFDVAAERRQTTETRPSDRERQYGMEIKLRNRKNVPVKVVVEEPVGGDVQLTQQSHPSVRKDANTVQWTVDVPVGKEIVLTYTARQRW